MAEYGKREALFHQLGVGVVAVAVDEPEDSHVIKRSHGLWFPLLSDVDHSVVTRFGLLNRKERGGIAYPATFVLDKDRSVRFRSLDRTAARASIDDVLDFLRAGLDSPPPKSKPKWVLPSLADFSHSARSVFGPKRKPKS